MTIQTWLLCFGWFVTAKPLTMFWLIKGLLIGLKGLTWFDCLSWRVWKSPQSHWMMRQITSLTSLKAAWCVESSWSCRKELQHMVSQCPAGIWWHLHAIPFRQLGVRLFVVGFLRQWNPQRRLKHPWQKVFWWFGICALMPALPWVRIVLMDAQWYTCAFFTHKLGIV